MCFVEVFTFPGNKKAKGHNELEGMSKEEQTREENIILAISQCFQRYKQTIEPLVIA